MQDGSQDLMHVRDFLGAKAHGAEHLQQRGVLVVELDVVCTGKPTLSA